MPYQEELSNEDIPYTEVEDDLAHVVPDGNVGDAVASNRVDVQVEGDGDSYEAERAMDSDDDRPFHQLNTKEIEALTRVVTGRDPPVPECVDLSQGHRVVADGDARDCSISDPHGDTIIQKGMIFTSMEEMKTWLQEYSIVHNQIKRTNLGGQHYLLVRIPLTLEINWTHSLDMRTFG